MIKEYRIENGMSVDMSKLESEMLSNEIYAQAHRGLVIPCHDIFLQYDNGILLVKRKNFPAKDILWPVGGRIGRGISTENSLRMIVQRECNLQIGNIEEIGHARTFFTTDPIGHGRGTDTLNIVYKGIGIGILNLDKSHEEPTIVTQKTYPQIRDTLHPYVRDHLDIIMSYSHIMC
jgi:hypothetical protein